MLIENNKPTAGYIRWTDVEVIYKGITYSITNGNTNKKFIWWDFSDPTVFQTSDTMPTLADTDFIAIYNDNGTYHLVSINKFHGDMLLDGSVPLSKLEEIPVSGGDNIILNSSLIGSASNVCPYFWEGSNTNYLIELDTLFPAREGNQLKMTITDAGGGGIVDTNASDETLIKVLPNTTYTLSFDYKVTAGDTLEIFIASHDNNNWDNYEEHVDENLTETVATRVSYTFTTPSFANLLYIGFFGAALGDIVYISHPKLEEGENASPYINNNYVDRLTVGIAYDLSWEDTKDLSN